MDVTTYWSRFPGRFVNRLTGEEQPLPGHDHIYTPKEWYETLVETVYYALIQLQNATFAKYGRAKRQEIHVYAHPDVACIFECSVLLKLLPEGSQAPDGKSLPVGRISDFSIWSDPILSNDTVRIVATFDVEDGAPKTLYGNIGILDMPENGRRA